MFILTTNYFYQDEFAWIFHHIHCSFGRQHRRYFLKFFNWKLIVFLLFIDVWWWYYYYQDPHCMANAPGMSIVAPSTPTARSPRAFAKRILQWFGTLVWRVSIAHHNFIDFSYETFLLSTQCLCLCNYVIAFSMMTASRLALSCWRMFCNYLKLMAPGQHWLKLCILFNYVDGDGPCWVITRYLDRSELLT